ncbi:MAG: TIGR04552 family protein [Polyangiales bacterium]
MRTFSLAELEAIRLLLRGGSVIDWHRLNFADQAGAQSLLQALVIDLEHPTDAARAEAVKAAAIHYLRRHFAFPVPGPVARASLPDLLLLASGKGHRQLCACSILKVMHIIHHLEARELAFLLPASDREIFHLVEQKVYRVIGKMLADGLPIVEFIGGRKDVESLYTKLLSKPRNIAAQIYDKLRFRLVTRSADDVFLILRELTAHLFPFNYVIPGESKNTLVPFRSHCEARPELQALLPRLQIADDLEAEQGIDDNNFTAPSYRVAHFVADIPVRLPDTLLQVAPAPAQRLGRVIFALAEFQILDEESEHANAIGDASHDAYKERQKQAVMRRLKLGLSAERKARRLAPKKEPL